MSDSTGIEPPRPTPEPVPLVQPLTVPAAASSRAPWIIGLVALVVFAAIGFLAAFFALSAMFARVNDGNDLAAAEKTVRAMDSAYADQDCDAFEAVTTRDARDEILGEDYDCDAWQAQAATLTVDGDYVYSVDVISSRKRGDVVTVTTEEAFADADVADYRYLLEQDSDGWVITAYGLD